MSSIPRRRSSSSGTPCFAQPIKTRSRPAPSVQADSVGQARKRSGGFYQSAWVEAVRDSVGREGNFKAECYIKAALAKVWTK